MVDVKCLLLVTIYVEMLPILKKSIDKSPTTYFHKDEKSLIQKQIQTIRSVVCAACAKFIPIK